MSASIFTTQTPSGGDFSDAAPGLTLGTLFLSDVDGSISGIRWYYPATLPGTPVIGLLYSYVDDTTGSELARATFSSPTAGTWNTVSFSAPVAITANTKYVACVFTADRYVATNGFFASSGVTNGHLTALANDDLSATNGKFHQGAAAAYPDSHFGASCYFVDVLFDLNTTTSAPAGLAAGTGTAYGASVAISGNAGAAAGTGAAYDITAAVRATVGCATGSGTAYGALGNARDIDFIISGAPEVAWRAAPPEIAWSAGTPEM